MAVGPGSLDGRRFAAVDNPDGEVDARTVFAYAEDAAGVISATYAGGDIVRGFLVGTRSGAALAFRYVHLNVAGETASGRCESRVVALPDGRLRLEERWSWESRDGSGTSAVEELA